MMAVSLALFASPQPARADAIIGSWAIEDKHDPITGKPWVIAQVKSDTEHNMWMQARCEGGIAILVFGVGGDGANFRIGEILQARLRIDDNTTLQTRGALEDVASGAIGTLLTKTLYEEMLGAKTMGVMLEREDGQQWAFTLRLSKTRQALQSMLRACPLASAPDSL